MWPSWKDNRRMQRLRLMKPRCTMYSNNASVQAAGVLFQRGRDGKCCLKYLLLFMSATFELPPFSNRTINLQKREVFCFYSKMHIFNSVWVLLYVQHPGLINVQNPKMWYLSTNIEISLHLQFTFQKFNSSKVLFFGSICSCFKLREGLPTAPSHAPT